MRRSVAMIAVCLVALAGCGGGEMSLTEYVDAVNELMVDANEDAAELLSSPEGALVFGYGFDLDDYSPQQLQPALEAVGEIEVEVQAAADAIDPPEVIADLHRTMFDSRFTVARTALAERVARHRVGKSCRRHPRWRHIARRSPVTRRCATSSRPSSTPLRSGERSPTLRGSPRR